MQRCSRLSISSNLWVALNISSVSPKRIAPRLSGQGKRVLFPAGAIIYREGEASAGMFVLFSGHVHLLKLGPQGQQSIVAEIEPVIMFNEVTVLDGGANLTTAIAVQECVTWNISHANFQALVQGYPMIGLGLLRVLSARTRNLMAQYEDLSFRSVLARTAKLLLDFAYAARVRFNARNTRTRIWRRASPPFPKR